MECRSVARAEEKNQKYVTDDTVQAVIWHRIPQGHSNLPHGSHQVSRALACLKRPRDSTTEVVHWSNPRSAALNKASQLESQVQNMVLNAMQNA